MVPTVCMAAKFAALCSKLTKKQKLIVQKMRLHKLLDIPSMPMQRMLLESLANQYNERDRSFTINGHVVTISTWDVYCILGLVDTGDKIELSRKQADHRLFNLYKQKGDTAISFKYLEERILREENEVHFSRMFVLYAIGTILAPSSKEYIGSNYLELVADVSKIKGLNWARFTLDHLLEHLALFKANKRKGLVGNLALLQVWYFEHFQATADDFDYASHVHPLIKNWPESKVMKRARLEGLKKIGAEKVVIHLELNESKEGICHDNLDQGIGDHYDEEMRHEYYENENCNNNVANEEVNQDCQKDDKSKIKESIESMKYLFEEIPEFHTVVQKLVNLVHARKMSTNCEGKQGDASSTRKPVKSGSNVDNATDRASPVAKMKKTEKVKTAEIEVSLGTSDHSNHAAEMDVASETSDQSNSSTKMEVSSGTSDQTNSVDAMAFSSGSSDQLSFFLGAKRKIDFVFSPTLVEKVKNRTNRQPSKACRSPYNAIEHKRVSMKRTKSVTVGEVINGLKLSDLEIAAITYVLEEIAINPQKHLVHVGESGLSGTLLNCLVRPVREDGLQKWLC